MPNKYNRRQIAALNRAIECMTQARRRYGAGEHAYQSGIRKDVLKGGITGEAFGWVEADHAAYEQMSKDISELHDLIEMLEDAPAFIMQERMSLIEGRRTRKKFIDEQTKSLG